MPRAFSALSFLMLGLTLSGCGQGWVEVRLDPVGSSDSRVHVAPKAIQDRVRILSDLLASGLPAKLGDREAKLRFFRGIAPAVVETMLEIEAERDIVDRYEAASKAGRVPAKLATDFADVSDRYQAKSADDLRARVDIPPLDMLFTQASIESAWGGSAVARDCKNIFGVHAATAAQKCPGHPILAIYPSFTGSIKRYVLLLNTGGAFKRFRKLRAASRASVGEHGALDFRAVVPGLLPYSERGQAYVNDVSNGIRQADLDVIYRAFTQKIY